MQLPPSFVLALLLSGCGGRSEMILLNEGERCNGLDDDGDGLIDDEDPDGIIDGSTYYLDSDGDGRGDAAASRSFCQAPPGWVPDSSDPEPDCATNDSVCGECGGEGDCLVGVSTAFSLYFWTARGKLYGVPESGAVAERVGEQEDLLVREVSEGMRKCALTLDGRVMCFVGAERELLEALTPEGAPFQGALSVASGLTQDVFVVDAQGRLTRGSEETSSYFVDAAGEQIERAVAVGASYDFACYLSEEGQVHCWGDNDRGKLGNLSAANIPESESPLLVTREDGTPLEDVAQLTVGFSHACARTNSQEIYCWGSRQYGQTGRGVHQTPSTIGQPFAERVDGTEGLLFRDIGAGAFHSCALSVDGNVYCWGWNGDGQLGVGESFGSYYSDHRGEALQLPIVGGQELAVGGDSGCVIDNESVLWCWGLNRYGELGDGIVDHGDACFHRNFDDCSTLPVRVVLPEID